MLDLAIHVVNTKRADFDPEAFEDEYEGALRTLVEKKAKGEKIDRLLHHAVVVQIEGSSYRLRQHADLMLEHVRSKAAINSPIPAQPPRRPRSATQKWSS